MSIKIGIVWFRHDFRLHDNEALTQAVNHCDVILPVYVFDQRLYENKSEHGFRQIGKYRAKFILESLNVLKRSFAERNIDLIIRYGITEDIIYEIANQVKSTWVFCNRERTPEEEFIQDELEKKLWQIGQELRFTRGKMLYHTGDLPFPIKHTPDTYAAFYREVGKIVPVRKPLPVPDKMLPYMDTVSSEPLPELTDLGFTEEESDFENIFKGGEKEALRMMDEFISNNFKATPLSLKERKKKTEVLVTHMSPYLNTGCISPKMVYSKINRFLGNKYHSNRASCIIHGLMRRDFFKLQEKKYIEKIFQKGGIKGLELDDLIDNWENFNIWVSAKTGVPIVDAFMRELNETGFIPFEGRRILSQFLIEELKVNWLMGAEYFASALIDYNPCSNYGNWNTMADVNFDAKEDRYCNFITKAKKLDPKGDLIRKWIPELSTLGNNYIHEPDKVPEKDLKKANIKLGEDYPYPVVDTDRWV